MDIDDLLNLDTLVRGDTVRKADFEATDPRIDIDSLNYDPETGIFSFEVGAAYTQYGDLIVEGADSASTEVSLVGGEPSRRDANAVQTLTLTEDPSLFTLPSDSTVLELNQDVDVRIAGVDIQLTRGLTLAEIGSVIESFQSAIIDKNPDIESVSYDTSTKTVDLVWKAEVGEVENIIVSSSNGTAPFTGSGIDVDIQAVKGDNSFLAQYRMYGFLNNETALDLGKVQDPGEGNLTEVGPIRVGFDTTSGYLNMVNGMDVAFGATAPAIRIFGADPTNPNDDLLDNDTDSLAGIVLDITGTTQYASDSIVKASSQDGYPKGDLIGVSFAETGEMVASFSNGQRQNLGLVAIANFENQAGLQPAGDTEWIATLNSGTAILNPPGAGLNGSLRSAALESSNVDLSAELVKLIEAQRNFQANSKTLETMNTVTQAILQI
ncbi:MAG: flagellar hook-basal body complex protein [Oceanospirillaceae bacterium]|nr:flagellar hook-basal body complex protein [Oceanospirillaceae bacterium]